MSGKLRNTDMGGRILLPHDPGIPFCSCERLPGRRFNGRLLQIAQAQELVANSTAGSYHELAFDATASCVKATCTRASRTNMASHCGVRQPPTARRSRGGRPLPRAVAKAEPGPRTPIGLADRPAHDVVAIAASGRRAVADSASPPDDRPDGQAARSATGPRCARTSGCPRGGDRPQPLPAPSVGRLVGPVAHVVWAVRVVALGDLANPVGGIARQSGHGGRHHPASQQPEEVPRTAQRLRSTGSATRRYRFWSSSSVRWGVTWVPRGMPPFYNYTLRYRIIRWAQAQRTGSCLR
jgi:hypothetical protein